MWREGEFEIHVTVRAPVDAVRAIQARLSAEGEPLGLTHIVLARGAHRSQVLLTRRLRGTLSEAVGAAERICARLSREPGARVVRVKVERDLRDACADFDSPDRGYCEHHVKLRTRADRLDAIETVARSAGGHLSRNAFAVSREREERFVTQRFDRGREREGSRLLASLLDALRSIAGCEILRVEREHVLLDTNLALDDGWLAEDTVSRGGEEADR